MLQPKAAEIMLRSVISTVPLPSTSMFLVAPTLTLGEEPEAIVSFMLEDRGYGLTATFRRNITAKLPGEPDIASFVMVKVFVNRTDPVVLFVAVTVALPETVKEFEGESNDRVPVVLIVTPVKVVELLMLKSMGVMATAIGRLWLRVPLVPVAVTV